MPDEQPTLDSPIDIPRIARIYDQTAAFYDEVVAAQQAPAKEAALEVLKRRPGERVLEVGVGTAWAFLRLIRATGVDGAVGVDVAPGMLQVARHRLQDEVGLEQAPLVLGDALCLPFAGATFDCLLCSYTLEVLPTEAMLPALLEFRRVLRPGGRLVVINLTDGEGAEDAAMTQDWRRRFLDDPEVFGCARPLHASGLLQQAGFVQVQRRYVGFGWPSEVISARQPS